MSVNAPPSATVSRVATSTTVATLLVASGARRCASVYNDSAGNLYIKMGAAASSTDFTVKLAASGLYELPAPVYGGIVTGILDAGTGNAQVTSY